MKLKADSSSEQLAPGALWKQPANQRGVRHSSDRQNAISSQSTAANEYPRVVRKLAVEISITTRFESAMNSPVSLPVNSRPPPVETIADQCG